MQSISSYHVLIRTQDFVWTLSQVFAVLNGSPLFIWVKWTAFAVLTRIPYTWKGKYRACVSQCIFTSFFLHWRLVSAMAIQTTCNANVCPIVCSQWHGGEHQSSALLALSEWKHRSAIVPLIKINNAESVLMSWRHQVCLFELLTAVNRSKEMSNIKTNETTCSLYKDSGSAIGFMEFWVLPRRYGINRYPIYDAKCTPWTQNVSNANDGRQSFAYIWDGSISVVCCFSFCLCGFPSCMSHVSDQHYQTKLYVHTFVLSMHFWVRSYVGKYIFISN